MLQSHVTGVSLIDDNQALINKIAWNYYPSIHAINSSVEQEDLAQELTMEVLRVSDRYDPTKGAQTTYITEVCRRCMANFYRKHNRRVDITFCEEVYVETPYVDTPELVYEVSEKMKGLFTGSDPIAHTAAYLWLNPSVLDDEFQKVKHYYKNNKPGSPLNLDVVLKFTLMKMFSLTVNEVKKYTSELHERFL